MSPSPKESPSDNEVQLLVALWSLGGTATVSQIHEVVQERRPVGYNAIGKAVAGMAVRGFVRKLDDTDPPQYLAVVDKVETLRAKIKPIADLGSYESVDAMMMDLIGKDSPADAAKLDEVRRLLGEGREG